MSEVLKGLYARREELERRIAAAQNAAIRGAAHPVPVEEYPEQEVDLRLQLKSVVTQIDVYANSSNRWVRGA